jgi:hypothetical protein
MKHYVVWSTHVREDRDPLDLIETRRTDRKVAEEDAALIRDLFKRKAWVQESE